MVDHQRRDRATASRQWQAFVDALQVLALVAASAIDRLEEHPQLDTCRELVTATTRVLDLAQALVQDVQQVRGEPNTLLEHPPRRDF